MTKGKHRIIWYRRKCHRQNQLANETVIEVSRSQYQSVLYLFDRCQISPKHLFALKINANMLIGRLMYYLIFSKNKNKAKLAVKCQCRNNQNVVEFSHFCNISISQGITYAAIQFFPSAELYNPFIFSFFPFGRIKL